MSQKDILDNRIEFLRSVEIFEDIPYEILMDVARVLKEKDLMKEEVVFRKDDSGDSMFIIIDGSVRIHVGNYVLTRLGKGKVFGEYALFDRELRSASVTAEEPTKLLQLDRSDFTEFMESNITIMKSSLKRVLKRIREMNELERKLAKSYVEIQKQKNEIEKQHRSIQDQKEELSRKNKELTQLNEEKHNLINVLAHDLRNPLTSSLCLADLLQTQTDKLDPDQIKSIEVIENSLRKLNRIINQILDINEIETRGVGIKPEKTNLALIIEEIKDVYKYALAQKNISIKLDIQKVEANIDRSLTLLIFENLLSNAIKFSPAGKEIVIRLFEKDGSAVTEIIDQGPGISEQDIKKLFGKYQQQVRLDRPVDEDEGIGLSIVKKYVDAMHGKVWCRSNPGKGSTLVVEFKALTG